MPNIPQQETIVQYVANSSQLDYTFAFYAPLPTDIEVFYQASNATPVPSNDLLALNSDYTVTYNADPITGGFITLLFTPTTGYYLTINRQVAASLNTSFGNAQAFNGNNLDTALDRLLLLCQQNQNYALQRNLSYIINTYLPDAQPFTQLPPLLQNQVWLGSGSGVVAAVLADNPSASVLQSLLANASPGTDGARIVGYYDVVNSISTTVSAFLQNIIPFIQSEVASQLFQSGDMKVFAGSAVQSGWLLCDGSEISRTTYADLFAAIGITWGAGNGTTTFNLPDTRRSTFMGSGGSATATIGNQVGDAGGEEGHVQGANEIVQHTHTAHWNLNTGGGDGGSFVDAAVYSSGSVHANTAVTVDNNVSTNDAMNVIQPSVVVTMIIKT